MSAATATMRRAAAATAAARSHTGESMVALRPDRAAFLHPAERAAIGTGVIRRDLAIPHTFGVLPLLRALLQGRRTGALRLALFRGGSRL